MASKTLCDLEIAVSGPVALRRPGFFWSAGFLERRISHSRLFKRPDFSPVFKAYRAEVSHAGRCGADVTFPKISSKSVGKSASKKSERLEAAKKSEASEASHQKSRISRRFSQRTGLRFRMQGGAGQTSLP